MKRIITAFLTSSVLLALVSVSVVAQPITMPRVPSPAATVSQTVGISTVTIRYSRPSVKGRTVWGDLVPFGWNVQAFGMPNPAPWRAGANENTVIELSHPATIEGQPVPAGSYGLFFVINKDDSGEVILSKDNKAWGNFYYHPEHDQMRARIEVRNNSHTEMLTYQFDKVTRTGAELILNWEKKQFPVKIEFAVDDIVLANAEAELNGAIGFQYQGYNTAANYTLQNNVALDKGLAWIEKSMTHGGNTVFNTYNIKSGILRKMGRQAEADKILEDYVSIANENDLNLYGYQFINQKNFDKAIEILTLNTKRYPKSANAWDSLGEAYALKGDKKNAIINFKKSLTLNPPEATKANSQKYLKQLGAL